MTREEILTKVANEKSYNDWGELMYDTHTPFQIEYTCEVMDIWAKQVAIEFAEWSGNNFKKMYSMWHTYYSAKYPNENLTTDQLYSLFREETQRKSSLK